MPRCRARQLGSVRRQVVGERGEHPRSGFDQAHARLRGPDALHLAVARHEGLPLATLDFDMHEVAIAEGLKVIEL